MIRPRQLALGILPLALLACPLVAQEAADQQADVLPGLRGLSVNGEIRIRPEYNDNYDFNDAVADSRDFTLLRTTLDVKIDRSERYQLFFQLRDSRVFGGERNAAGGIPGNTTVNQGNVDLHQGYIDYHPKGAPDWKLRLGRQEINYGDQRIVGALNWTNVARSFDGLRAVQTRDGRELELIHLTIGDATLGPGGVTAPDDQTLSGLHHTWDLGEHTLQGYLFRFRDEVALNALSQTGTPGEQDFFVYGVRALGPLGESGLDFKTELAFQKGDFSTDDLDATAFALILGKTLDDEGRDRIELEFDWSPGDEAKLGERGTWQTLFPTNHVHYGIADRLAWQNMRALRLSWFRKLQGTRNLRLDLWKLDLDDTRDAWYRATGAVVRPGSPGAPRDLGTEVDLRYTWKDDVAKHQVGVARVFGGDFQAATSPTGASDDATFAYWMTTVRF